MTIIIKIWNCQSTWVTKIKMTWIKAWPVASIFSPLGNFFIIEKNLWKDPPCIEVIVTIFYQKLVIFGKYWLPCLECPVGGAPLKLVKSEKMMSSPIIVVPSKGKFSSEFFNFDTKWSLGNGLREMSIGHSSRPFGFGNLTGCLTTSFVLFLRNCFWDYFLIQYFSSGWSQLSLKIRRLKGNTKTRFDHEIQSCTSPRTYLPRCFWKKKEWIQCRFS